MIKYIKSLRQKNQFQEKKSYGGTSTEKVLQAIQRKKKDLENMKILIKIILIFFISINVGCGKKSFP